MEEKINLVRVEKNSMKVIEDQVAQEVPVTINLNGQEVVTFLCTPQHLEELAAGYLLGEGLVREPAYFEEITADYRQGIVNVRSKEVNKTALATMGKRYLTTGCGGGTSFYHVMDRSLASRLDAVSACVTLAQMQAAMKFLQTESELFKSTGGVHACALFDGDRLLVLREDVGRHNAADKVLGWYLRHGQQSSMIFFLTTGRVSSEILLKVAKANIPILISRSAATSLAVEMAREIGITLVGFLRGNRANIYSGEKRISVE